MRGWTVIDPVTRSASAARPGVYVILLCGRPVYVGQSASVRSRLMSHGIKRAPDGWTETPWGEYEAKDITAKVCYPHQYGDWLKLEARLIRRLRPFFNRRGTA